MTATKTFKVNGTEVTVPATRKREGTSVNESPIFYPGASILAGKDSKKTADEIVWMTSAELERVANFYES